MNWIGSFLSFIRMSRKMSSLIKLIFVCSCLLSNISQSLQDSTYQNPFLTKDFANLFTTSSPTSTSTTTPSPTTVSTFPPPFNLPFQFTAPSSSSSSSSSSLPSNSGINWNYPSIFKYQSTNEKRTETSSPSGQNNNNNNNNNNNQYNNNNNNNRQQDRRPVVNYGKAPIELYTMMSMKKGRYFPPAEDNDGYSGLIPKSGSNVIGPNGQMMQPGIDPSIGSGFAAMQGLEAAPSGMGGYDASGMGYIPGGFGGHGGGFGGHGGGFGGHGGGFGGHGGGFGVPALGSQGMAYGGLPQQYPMASTIPSYGAASTIPSYGAASTIPSYGAASTIPSYGATSSFGMGSPYGVPSTMSPMANAITTLPYASPAPHYYGFPNMQPAASSLYSAYAGGYGAAPGYPGIGSGIGPGIGSGIGYGFGSGIGSGIGGYGSGMYPMGAGGGYGSGMYPMGAGGGLLGAASQTMGTILAAPFAALAHPSRYMSYLFPFG